MQSKQVRQRTRRLAGFAGAAVVIGVILWIDITTGLWQDLVILGGLAAGLVTFLLTVLVLDRMLQRSAEQRWAPVNRLALSEFLHAIADDEHSEISRGTIVPRIISPIAPEHSGEVLRTELDRVRKQLVKERTILTHSLSRWTEFLASSGDNEAVLLHIAQISLQFDRVRDASLEVEASPDDPILRAAFDAEVTSCNDSIQQLAAELQARLETPPWSPMHSLHRETQRERER